MHLVSVMHKRFGSMARTTISLPDELKAQMDKSSALINWSEVAANAFRAELERISIRKQRTEGKKMSAAIERLKKSKLAYAAEGYDRGHAAGVLWAQDTAEYGELKRLSNEWESAETTETDDAYGSPGVFLRMISGEDQLTRTEVDDLLANVGLDKRDDDAYSPDYWDGFVEGALEVFDKVED